MQLRDQRRKSLLFAVIFQNGPWSNDPHNDPIRLIVGELTLGSEENEDARNFGSVLFSCLFKLLFGAVRKAVIEGCRKSWSVVALASPSTHDLDVALPDTARSFRATLFEDSSFVSV